MGFSCFDWSTEIAIFSVVGISFATFKQDLGSSSNFGVADGVLICIILGSATQQSFVISIVFLSRFSSNWIQRESIIRFSKFLLIILPSIVSLSVVVTTCSLSCTCSSVWHVFKPACPTLLIFFFLRSFSFPLLIQCGSLKIEKQY